MPIGIPVTGTATQGGTPAATAQAGYANPLNAMGGGRVITPAGVRPGMGPAIGGSLPLGNRTALTIPEMQQLTRQVARAPSGGNPLQAVIAPAGGVVGTNTPLRTAGWQPPVQQGATSPLTTGRIVAAPVTRAPVGGPSAAERVNAYSQSLPRYTSPAGATIPSLPRR